MADTDTDNPLQGFTTCFFCDNPSFCHGWSERELATLDDKVKLAIALANRLEAIGAEIASMYTSLHDKDNHEYWNDHVGAYLTPKHPHIHVYVMFKKDKKIRQSKIAKAIGIDFDEVMPFGRGSNSHYGALAYLMHAKEELKYRYDPRDVYTFCGEDYMDIYTRKKVDWDREKAAKTAKQAKKPY